MGNAKTAGTTGTVIIHDYVAKKLTIAHIADSTAVIGKYRQQNGARELVGFKLTRDHRPEDDEERRRIKRAGGRIIFDGSDRYRVYTDNKNCPALDISRCFGSFTAHDCGVSCEAEVSEYQLCTEDQILLLCSRGVWDTSPHKRQLTSLRGLTRKVPWMPLKSSRRGQWRGG